MKIPKIEIEKLEKSRIAITGEIDTETFMSFKEKALDGFVDAVELPGFRKGKAPRDLVLKHIGDKAILEEMAELALAEVYPVVIKEEKIDAIGRPEITLTKIALDNPLGFKITTAVVPEIELPDYKKIAKEENKNKKETTLTDEELEEGILKLRKYRAHEAIHAEGHAHDNHEHGEALDEKNLPAFDEEYVKSLGKFESVDDFKTKFKEQMLDEKKWQEKEKIRIAILEKVLEDMKVEVPDILVSFEENKIIEKLESDIANMGLDWNDYLKRIGKTEDDIRKEFHDDAEKRAKLSLAIEKIGKEENLAPTEEEIEDNVKDLMSKYEGVDPLRARLYVEEVLRNQKVLEFLETL